MELTEKGISYGNLKTFNQELQKRYAAKTEIPTKISVLENDAKYQTEEQVNAKVNAKVASLYRPGGSVAFADLPERTETNLGLVVNVTDEFTTTDDFVEGAGQKHSAGTNVGVVQSGEEYKYDVFSGFVDLSGYVQIADMETATTEEILALFEDEPTDE